MKQQLLIETLHETLSKQPAKKPLKFILLKYISQSL